MYSPVGVKKEVILREFVLANKSCRRGPVHTGYSLGKQKSNVQLSKNEKVSLSAKGGRWRELVLPLTFEK